MEQQVKDELSVARRDRDSYYNTFTIRAGPTNDQLRQGPTLKHKDQYVVDDRSEFMGKMFQVSQLTHERFLTIDHSCKFFF